jgi:glycosyltransferase involved in cell wall biosynthesis
MSMSNQPLRLVLVANRHEHNDGQGRVNYEVAYAALERGFKVTLLSAYCAQEIANHPNARFIRIGREGLPSQLLKNLAFASQSASWLRQHRGEYDLVQANGFVTWVRCDIVTAHFVHSAWAKSRYFPYTISLHPLSLYQRLFTALNARWERAAFAGARKVIAVSELVAQEVRALGVTDDRIQVIYNGVDTGEFFPGCPERASFGLPENVPMALFAGDIRSPRKNVHTVLRAIQEIPDLHLVVAGDMKSSSAPELARRLKIGDRVHFLGKLGNMGALMRSVDLFLFPSLYEPFGLVALEAAASGLPMILCKNVGAADALDGVVELVQNPESPEELASRTKALLRSIDTRRTMAELARQRALTMQWSNVAEGYLNLYEQLGGRN